jgi:3-hydroxybutyryl-CoA dehydrogenase
MQKKKLVIVGCGTMGCDVAAIFLSNDWQVQAVAPDARKWDDRRARMKRALGQLGCEDLSEQVQFVTNPRDIVWDDVAFAVESVPEDFDLKRAIFIELDLLVPVGIPLLTNTSGFRITEIARDCKTRERTAGLHFFLPAHLVPAVEVVRGEYTEGWVIERLDAIVRSVKRVPIKVSKDIPGFLANRIQHALMREAFAVIDDGLASAEDVDAAVRFGFGFRYVAAGPILQKELSGLDTQLAAGRSIYPSLHNGSEPSKILSDLVASGRLGTKSGGGFWDWTPEEAAIERERFEQTLVAAAKLLNVTGSLEAGSLETAASAARTKSGEAVR